MPWVETFSRWPSSNPRAGSSHRRRAQPLNWEVAEGKTPLGIAQHLGSHPGLGKQLVTGDAQFLDQIEQGGSVGDRYQFGREIQGWLHGLSGGIGHIWLIFLSKIPSFDKNRQAHKGTIVPIRPQLFACPTKVRPPSTTALLARHNLIPGKSTRPNTAIRYRRWH